MVCDPVRIGRPSWSSGETQKYRDWWPKIMPLACQLMKPLCLLVGTEKHVCLGVSPLGPPLPNPNEICISVGVIDMPVGDSPSATVSGHNARLIMRGHDSKFLRPHFSTGLPPLPSAVPPVVDLGLIAIVIGLGQAKAVWGPFSIKADFGEKKNPAVIFLAPGFCLGAANFSVCSEPVPKVNIKGVQIIPNVFNIQMPSTVFAGMTLADVVGNIVGAVADAVAAKLLELVFKYVPGVKWIKKKFEKLVEKVLGFALKPVLRRLTAKLTERAIERSEGRFVKVLGSSLSKEFAEKYEEKIEKLVDHQVERMVERAAEKGVDKALEIRAAPLTEKGVEFADDHAKEYVEEHFGEEGKEGGEGVGEGAKEAGEGAEEAGERKAPGEGKVPGEPKEPGRGHSE